MSVTDFYTIYVNKQINHDVHNEGRFYTIPEPIKKQLFANGGLPKTFTLMSHTLNELCLMVRKPSLEIIDHLKETDHDAPVVRYVLCKFHNYNTFIISI